MKRPDRVRRPDRPATDVLFGQAYFLRFDPKLWEAQQPYAPLGALYAAAVRARSAATAWRCSTRCSPASEAEWAAALDRHRPRFAVIYEDSFNYLSKMCLLRMRAGGADDDRCRAQRAASSRSSPAPTPAIIRRSISTAAPTSSWSARARSRWSSVLDVLAGRRANAARAGATASACATPTARSAGRRAATIIRDLDALPLPAWDLVDVDRYRALWRRAHGYYSMNLATTRGCPYHCNWCAKPIYGQRYTSRSPEHVVDEIAVAQAHLSAGSPVDGRRHLRPQAGLDRAVRGAGPRAGRRDSVQVPAARRSGDAGRRRGARGRRAAARCGWAPNRARSAFSTRWRRASASSRSRRRPRGCATPGIEVGFFLQFGYPGETREDIEQTLQMVRACRPDDIGVSVSYPLPGTPFYERVEAQLGAEAELARLRRPRDAVSARPTSRTSIARCTRSCTRSSGRASRRARWLAPPSGRGRWRRHAREAPACVYHGVRVPCCDGG